MADNIMGPEVNLGLNVNLELDRSAQDASTLADQIKQMRIDQEAFRDVISDTQERLREMTSEYQSQLSLRQQMVDAEQSLRNLSDSRTQSLQDQVSAYREMEQSMSRLGQGMSGMQMPYGGGMGGMSGFYGGGMSGYYNPMSGQMMGMSGYPSAFGENPEEEILEEEMANDGEKRRGIFNGINSASQKLFYPANVAHEFQKSLEHESHPLNQFLTGASTVKGLGGLAPKSLARWLPKNIGFLGKASPYIMAAEALYKVGSDFVTTGQDYGALTGTDSAVSGYASEFQANLGSWFGLNPLLPTGVSQEIQSTGLAAGYQQGSDNLNRYRSFASGNYERFKMSAGESQKLYDTGTFQAKVTLEDLTLSLQNLGQQAADTGMSFGIMRKNFLSGLDMLSGMGLTGRAASSGASALAGEFGQLGPNDKMLLKDLPGQLSRYGDTLQGQAMAANAMGVPVTGLYNKLSSMKGGVNGTAAAFEMANAGPMMLIRNLGLRKGATKPEIGANALQLQMGLQQMGINVNTSQAVEYANALLNHPDKIAAGMSGKTGADLSFGDYLSQHHIKHTQKYDGPGTIELYRTKSGKYLDKDELEKQWKKEQESIKSNASKTLQNILGQSNNGQTVTIDFTPQAQHWLRQGKTKNSVDIHGGGLP